MNQPTHKRDRATLEAWMLITLAIAIIAVYLPYGSTAQRFTALVGVPAVGIVIVLSWRGFVWATRRRRELNR